MKFPLLVLLVVFLILSLCGCKNGGGPNALTTSQSVGIITSEIGKARVGVEETRAVVREMTPETVEIQKPAVDARLESVDEHLATAVDAGASAAKTAAADEKKVQTLTKEVQTLKQDDPVRSWLMLIGIGAIVVGVGGLIGSFFVGVLFQFRTAAAAVCVFGFMLVTIARFLTQIYWIAGLSLLACVIAGGIWLWANRSVAKAQAKDLETWLKENPKP